MRKRSKIKIYSWNASYFFELYSSNGICILSSPMIKRKSLIYIDIFRLKEYGRENTNFIKKEKKGKYYFEIRVTRKGRKIAHSNIYNTKEGRDNGINAVINAIDPVDVLDLTYIKLN